MTPHGVMMQPHSVMMQPHELMMQLPGVMMQPHIYCGGRLLFLTKNMSLMKYLARNVSWLSSSSLLAVVAMDRDTEVYRATRNVTTYTPHTHTTHTHAHTHHYRHRQTLTIARGLIPFELRKVRLQFEFAFIYLLFQNVLLVQEEDD